MSDEYKNDQAPAEAQDPVTAEQERYAHPEFYTPERTEPNFQVEKHDLPAMMCSAYLVIRPACVLAILAICLVGYLLFS